jgi:hypothetical protein
MPEDPMRTIAYELADLRRELTDLKVSLSRLADIIEELDLWAGTR